MQFANGPKLNDDSKKVKLEPKVFGAETWGELVNEKDVIHIGWCHECQRLFLVKHAIVVRAIKGPQPQRNPLGDISGSLADFYHGEK